MKCPKCRHENEEGARFCEECGCGAGADPPPGTRRGLTRFVGRDTEFGLLRRAQHLVGTGHGKIAAIIGEAGVGKSRLIYEFTHSHRLRNWLVLESAAAHVRSANRPCW